MKKIVLVLGTFILFLNCSVDNDASELTFHFETMPVNDVYVPENFGFGETYNIMVDYNVPSTCYSFNTFYFEQEGNVITAAVINSVLNDQLCEPYIGRLAQASFDLKIDMRGTYVFKFWRGKDNFGEDNYYTIEVPVTE